MRRILGLALAALSVLVIATAAHAGPTVKVTKEKPVVQTKTIDPENPPPELKKDEAGVCVCNFSCSASFGFQVLSQELVEEPPPPVCTVEIKITDVDMTIDLHITKWLPADASDKLKEHEDGHREICEDVYKNAQKAAKDAASGMVGQTVTGQGPDCNAALADAAAKATGKLCDAYAPSSKDVAQDVGDKFDDITSHGTNEKPTKDGVKEAFKQYKAEQKAKKKAEKPKGK